VLYDDLLTHITANLARLSPSGLAMNLIIDTQLHTVPLRSLIPVLERESPRKSAAVRAG
jgi:CRISPR/Cas system-associated protein Cas7 (RAMP superfamily)